MKALKILVVEDEFTSRKLLMNLLAAYGEVDIAVNGQEAIDAARRALERDTPYQLICLDIMLPELDGQAALLQLRELESAHGIMPGDGAKVVMTTAMNDSRNVMASFRGQADGYIVKPVVKTAIVDQLQKLGLI